MTETSPLGVGRAARRGAPTAEDERSGCARRRAASSRWSSSSAASTRSAGTASSARSVRGPWIARAYYGTTRGEREVTEDGWLRTGDVAEIDRRRLHQARRPHQGPGQVGRRVDLVGRARERDHGPPEGHGGGGDRRARRAVGRAAAARASCRARARTSTPTSCATFLAERVAKWWMPERIEFIDEVPRRRSASSTRRCSAGASPRRRPPTARRDRLARARAAPRPGRDRAARLGPRRDRLGQSRRSSRAAPAKPRSRRSSPAWLRDAGLEVVLDEAGARARAERRRARPRRGGGRTLLLCAHIDTVGVEGMTDPHVPRVDGRAALRPRRATT